MGEDEEIIDYAIIGAGVAGTYCAWRLKDCKNEAKVVLYERSDRIGGRLLSVKMPNSKQTVELGGMRYRPEEHLLFSELVRQMNLETKKFPMGTVKDPFGNNNIAYFRGRGIKIEDLKDPQKNPFHLSSFVHGMTPDELQRQIVRMFVPNWKSLEPDQWFDVKMFGKPLWRWGFWNLLYKILSPEEYSFLKYGSGYDTNVSNGNSVALLPTGQDYSPGRTNPFLTLKDGMDSLPKKLTDQFVAKGGKLEKNHRLNSIQTVSENGNKRYKLEFTETQTTEGRTIDLEKEPIKVEAENVILALPRASLEFIDWKPFKTDKDLKEKLKSVIKQASIKIILEYNHAWWLSLGRVYGRSLTDLPIRQTMYFTSDSEAQEFEEELKTDSLVTKTSTKPAVLMASYNDIETVPFWKGFQKDGCDFPGDEYAATESMVKEAHRQVAEMHGQRALPDPISAKYFDWTQEPFGAAWHCWKPNYNYKDIMQSILHPVAGENIFICGEAYSNDQGWAEGALETAELVLTKKLKIKELLPQKSTTRGLSEKKVFGYQPDLLRRLRY